MNNLKKKLSVIAVMFAFMLAFTLIPAANADAAQNTHKYSGADYIINQGKSVQLPNSNIKSFVSDTPKVATVNSTGKVVGKKGGYAVITATSAHGATYKYEVGVKSKTYYPSNKTMYKVGKDIPAGQYVVIHDMQVKTSDNFTYWAIYKKKNSGLMRNDGFSYTSIVTLKKGQYFELHGGYAVPIKKVNKNIFSVKNLNKYAPSEGATVKVGYGFAPGTYKFTLKATAKGRTSGTVYVATKDRGLNLNYDYVERYYLSKTQKSATIKLKKGQYVEMSGCTVKRVK